VKKKVDLTKVKPVKPVKAWGYRTPSGRIVRRAWPTRLAVRCDMGPRHKFAPIENCIPILITPILPTPRPRRKTR
jgi:hypothetical protein